MSGAIDFLINYGNKSITASVSKSIGLSNETRIGLNQKWVANVFVVPQCECSHDVHTMKTTKTSILKGMKPLSCPIGCILKKDVVFVVHDDVNVLGWNLTPL